MHEYPHGLPWFLRPSHWFLFERPVLSSDINRVFTVLLTLNSRKDRCASNEHACSRTATPPAAKATPRVGGAQMKGFGEIRTIPVCSVFAFFPTETWCRHERQIVLFGSLKRSTMFQIWGCVMRKACSVGFPCLLQHRCV